MARKMPITEAELYKFHVQNLRSIETALSQIELFAKDAIRKERQAAIDSLLRTYLLLLGAWTECRLKKLLYEKNGFQKVDRDAILAEDTQLKRWLSTVDIGFKKRYGVKRLTDRTLKYTDFSRYTALRAALVNDIGPVIELRNKLAHGQWHYPLTNAEDAVAQEAMKQINTENFLSSQFKLQIVSCIATIVNDLVVSVAFERDFDTHFTRFMNAHNNLMNRDYDDYARQLKERHKRGKQQRSTT